MPLIYPLAFQGGNIQTATYTVGGFSRLASFNADQKPSTFTVDTNNGLHNQFESSANVLVSEFLLPGLSNYKIEVTAVPTLVFTQTADDANFNLRAFIANYNDAFTSPLNIEGSFVVAEVINNVQTSIASVGDSTIVTIPELSGTNDSRGFGFEMTTGSNNTTCTGNFSFKITKLS